MRQPNLRLRDVPAILAAIALLSQSACVFLESSGSFSDSSGSFSDSSKSSSGSSSNGDGQAYRQDVRDFTSALASADGTPSALRRGLTEIALVRGISDWEAIDETYSAVGEGLALAGVSTEQFSTYQKAIAPPGSSGFNAVRSGYASAQR